MGQRVQRDAALKARGVIAQAVGNEGVGELVHRDREEQCRDLKDETLEEDGRVAEEIAHPRPGSASSSAPGSRGNSGPGMR
jgi:hypothetical protein